MSNNDALKANVVLKFASSEFKVAGSNVKKIILQALPWGFYGELEFIVINYPTKDALYADFIKANQIKISFTVERGLQPPKNTKVSPVTVEGIVSERKYRETAGDIIGNVPVAGNPVLFRTYFIKFTDPAAYYWREHYPAKYYSDTDMSSVVQANLVDDIKLRIDWDVMKVKQPNLTVYTGFGEEKCVSFYDFVLWYIETNGGFFIYQYAESRYLITDKRPEPSSSDTITCDFLDLESVEIGLPTVESSQLQIINGVASGPSIEKCGSKSYIAPLSRDLLVREDIPKKFQSYVKLQNENELEQISPESHLEYRTVLYQMFYPEDTITCNQQTWSKQSYLYGKKFRVFSFGLTAVLCEDKVTDHLAGVESIYSICFKSVLHEVADSKKRFPAYRTPEFPLVVEGVVISDGSQKDSTNYKIVNDKETSSDYLEVEIPVWEKIKARVQHDPGQFTGQFYFPPYNGQKVLLGFWFSQVQILRNLDWREYAPLPQEGQGNHLVFGTKSDSRSSIQHSYVENKPKLDINRVLEQDMETISLSEGSIILRTRQEKKE